MAEMKQLYDLFSEILALFDDLLQTEGKKLAAVEANDVALLDEYMKEEQAFTLKLRGLDQKREALQEELGFGGQTLRQIIESTSPAEGERLQQAYEQLNAKTGRLQTAIASTRECIELRMKGIEALLEQNEQDRANGYRQSRDAAPTEDKPRFTSTDV